MEKFIKAIFDAENRTMTAWTDHSEVEFWTYTQDEYDDYVTYENVVNYLKDASELPDDFESYEDWADGIFACNQQDEIMFDTSYWGQWDEICRLAGISDRDVPYCSCCSYRSFGREVA